MIVHNHPLSITAIYRLLMGCGLAVLCIVVAWHGLATSPDTVLRVSFLNIGQGDAVFVRFPDGVTMLIDGGPDNTVVNELGSVIPWWDYSIDYLLMTHSDLDHYGGFYGVLEKYDVGTLFYNGDAKDDAYYENLFDRAREQGVEIRTLHQGDRFELSAGISMDVLWPPEKYESSDANARSITVLLAWNDVEFMLTGDLPEKEELLVAAEGAVRADVLKVGHHGSRTSSNELFLKAVSPRWCVVSSGQDNKFGHPHEEVVARLAAVGCTIFRTYADGTISFSTDGTMLDMVTKDCCRDDKN